MHAAARTVALVAVFAAVGAFAQTSAPPQYGDEIYKPNMGQAGKDVIWIPTPDSLVTRMLQAAKTGDRDIVFELLSPQTRERLEREAKRATDLVGAAVRYSAKDLVSIGSSDGVAPPTDITVIEERGERAIVEVVSPAGRSRIELVRIDGRWLIDLPSYGTM